MSDLIRRQDVLAYPIRADHYDREHGNKHFIAGIESVMEYVECLPSAEPERHLTCKNCIHLGHAYMMPCKNCKRNQMLPDWYEER